MTSANNVTTFPSTKENVLQFPKPEGFLGNTAEEIQASLAENVTNWISTILPVICSSTFSEISKFGINLFDPALAYDMTMVQEACRSLMMASLKLDHPFQEISREILETDEYGGVSIYAYTDVHFDPDEDPDDDTN